MQAWFRLYEAGMRDIDEVSAIDKGLWGAFVVHGPTFDLFLATSGMQYIISHAEVSMKDCMAVDRVFGKSGFA